jgi:histidinol dehydrogenase
MRIRRFEWEGAFKTGKAMRAWTKGSIEKVEVRSIHEEVVKGGDKAVRALTARFDATERLPDSLRVDPTQAEKALAGLDASVREAIEVGAANIRAVAEAQVETDSLLVELPQGQTVTVRSVAVGAAGIYAPGGRAAYPSSVLMCAIPAQVAGTERIALASPPGADGCLHPSILAAAAFCEIDEIYAMGGAQAIFALAHGTETIREVDVIAGPGNAWVQEAKRRVYGFVGIDSYAGPSELMVVAGPEVDPEWAALDLCAQAEHGPDSPLVVAACDDTVLKAVKTATESAAAERTGIADAPLALVLVPGVEEAVNLANVFAPEHLELLVDEGAQLAERVRTAGCVFIGPYGATAFGDYAAGSNHVLPTTRAGRFTGPLGPDVFRRKISTVQISAEAAGRLAPHVDTLARAEGFPVHGESAMIRK